MAETVQVKIDESLSGKVRLAVLTARSLAVDEGTALWSLFEPLCEGMKARHEGVAIGEVPGVQVARELYRTIGVDPTKVRPSSEALLRRVLQGKPLYRVNSLVDTINYCSLCTLLPMGLYDLRRIEGENIVLRRGRPGESFEGIRKGEVNLEGRYALFDKAGPFGSPTSDSKRASIRPETTSCLVVLFSPFTEKEEKTLLGHAEFTARQIERFGGGQPDTESLGIVG
ncbi:MAG: phenylalanine--tRNA ligase beta subunit-related protein [Gemmatimonadota bacterium]|nr:phenylalanine--tRNA ligase beta subunit-related protein [Gemmatimonadota bacterium]